MTVIALFAGGIYHFISTHTSRVGCDDGGVNELEWLQYISTHTSRVGCDGFGSETSDEPLEISTHTSRVGCDFYSVGSDVAFMISTHTSRVGCDGDDDSSSTDSSISTHTSRVGCDKIWCPRISYVRSFLLTHPVWDVTPTDKNYDFKIKFLLTHPVWDVTGGIDVNRLTGSISTHTSRVGCDAGCRRCNFELCISTHTSRVGCDDTFLSTVFITKYFYSHIPCGM